MKKQNELDKESIQIWCEQLSLCKPQPMSHKLCECFRELLTPKGMSFGDTNTSSLFLLLPIIAF